MDTDKNLKYCFIEGVKHQKLNSKPDAFGNITVYLHAWHCQVAYMK